MKSSSLHAIAAAAAGIVGAAWCTRLAMRANAGSDRIREEEAATAVWVWMGAKQTNKTQWAAKCGDETRSMRAYDRSVRSRDI
jgi:hypothetical protein